MSSETVAGPFVVVGPQGWVNPAHEHQAVGIGIARDHRRDHKPIQVHTHGHGLTTLIPCSRAEWMTFVEQVKAGRFDMPIPDETGNTGKSQ